MQLAVVTGATGHLGNTLVRHLLERGIRTRVLLRPGYDEVALDGLDVERARGDVTDDSALNEAFTGADVVFHVAGLVSITTGHEAELERVNVGGTRAVVEACKRAGVRRLVYTSSCHALTEPAGGVLDETAGFDPVLAHGPYGKSKAAASKLVQDAARNGELDSVLVLPTGCLGPWDFRLSEVGNLVMRVSQRRMPIIIDGGYDWVDVRDVAAGTLAAAEKGRTGEAYLLNAAHATTGELCAMIATAAGVPAPRLSLPLWVAAGVAQFGPLWERLTDKRALLTPYAVHTLAVKFTFSAEKARRELGFTARPLAQSLADALQWLRTHPASPMLARSLKVGPGRSVANQS